MYKTMHGKIVTEEEAQWFYAKTKWAFHWAVPTGEGYGYYHRKEASGKAVVAWRPFTYVLKDADAVHPHDMYEAVPVVDPLTFEEMVKFAKWRIM